MTELTVRVLTDDDWELYRTIRLAALARRREIGIMFQDGESR